MDGKMSEEEESRPPFSPDGVPEESPHLEEVRRRWKRCVEWESYARDRFLDDMLFAFGDSDNGYQWPSTILRTRDGAAKPCLTMNVVQQHNLQIVNEARQAKSSVGVVAVGNGASKEAADMFDEVIRNIEYSSLAEQGAYQIARTFQVNAGWGYWRLVTEWGKGDSWHQEIRLRAVDDPLNVYLDPDHKLPSGLDAEFAFIFDEMDRDDFKKQYPKYAMLASSAPLGDSGHQGDFVSQGKVRICEYFHKVEIQDELVNFRDGKGRKTIRKSLLPKEVYQQVVGLVDTRTREVSDHEVRWELWVGDQMVDETVWPGKYIPIVKCVGQEVVLDRILDRKSHTRSQKDAQRMLNYNASAQVEFVALQSKTPYIAAVAGIEEHTQVWATANREDHSVLPYRHKDAEGDPIPPPVRQQPPTSSPAYEQGMQTAFNQLMMVSGQWQNQMGMAGNERTGEAIARRQQQGDTATFHFQDNYEAALLATGMQLIDLIPKVYTAKRVLRMQAEDGVEREVEIDPAARQAYLEEQSHAGEVVKRVFNPAIGQYDVRSKPGPSYGTKREQTGEVIKLILTQAPQLTPLIGDLLLASLDFPEAIEAAQRLRRMMPPQALGKGPSPQEQQMQQQIQGLQGALAKALQATAKDQLKLVGKDQMRDIDVYKAQTDRLKALAGLLPEDMQDLGGLLQQTMQSAEGVDLGQIVQANAGGIGDANAGGQPQALEQPQAGAPQGARQAPDGNWYMPDPSRPGKYLLLKPKGVADGT
jgi:hypothetical protein